MAIQGNINQLINATAYFAKPIGDKRRELQDKYKQARILQTQKDIIGRNENVPLSMKENIAQKELEYAQTRFDTLPYQGSYHYLKKATQQRETLAQARHIVEMRKAVDLEEARKKFRQEIQEEEKKKQEEALLGGKV